MRRGEGVELGTGLVCHEQHGQLALGGIAAQEVQQGGELARHARWRAEDGDTVGLTQFEAAAQVVDRVEERGQFAARGERSCRQRAPEQMAQGC